MNSFPIYRKLANNKVFYKIVSDSLFEEIQIVGNKRKFSKIEATIFPEKLKIKDMMDCLDGFYLELEEEVWLSELALVS